jgi:LysM repeat protein
MPRPCPARLAVAAMAVVMGLGAVPAGAEEVSVHRIRPGDTVSALAHRYGTTVAELVRVNRLANPDRIIAGRALSIPGSVDTTADAGPGSHPGVRHRVQPG